MSAQQTIRVNIFDTMSQSPELAVPNVLNQVNKRHKRIVNFTPYYASLVSADDDSNVHKKLRPPLPLVVSSGIDVPYTGLSGSNITAMVPSYIGRHLVFITDTGYVYATDTTTDVAMGQPTGSIGSNYAHDVEVFNGKVVAGIASKTALYYADVTASPTWTSFGSLSASKHYLKTFGSKCYVTDISGLSVRLVKIIDSAWTVSSGLDLGADWSVTGLENDNEEFLAVFAQKTDGGAQANPHVLFLWNGLASDSYTKAIQLNGQYRCSAVKDGVMHFITSENGSITISRRVGFGIEALDQIIDLDVQTFLDNPKAKMGVRGNFFVVATEDGMLFWDPYAKISFIAYSGVANEVLTVAPHDSYEQVYLGRKNLSSFYLGSWKPLVSATLGTVSSAEYESNWMPPPNDAGERIHVDHIEVVYNVKPPSSSDIITVTITSKDDLESETENTDTVVIKDTTANSTNAYVDDKRAVSGPIGRDVTDFKIDIDMTVSGASQITWFPTIPEILIHYTPITSQR